MHAGAAPGYFQGREGGKKVWTSEKLGVRGFTRADSNSASALVFVLIDA